MNQSNLPNPFTQQTMIRDAEQFVGRRAELDQISNLLKKMQGISLVGERRIGKSSLLYHIFLTRQTRLGEEMVVAYTDFPGVKDEKSFYQCLCEQLGRMGDKFSDLQDAVRNRRVVFCLDEFERVMRSPAFSREFFDTLRSLAQTGNLTLLIATEHPLSELSLTKQIATSPFFNIFRQIEMGLFTPEEALEFIHNGFDEANAEITENETERVLRLAGRFPFFLQLACYCLFEMKVGRAKEWERAFRRDAKPHLRYLWDRLKPAECTTLRRLLQSRWRVTLRRVLFFGRGRPEKQVIEDQVIEDLEQRGLLVRDDEARNGWSGFGEVFEEIVLNPPSMSWRDRAVRWLLPLFEEIEISFWPPGVKFKAKTASDKQRTEDNR
jgi:AAA+ ATPase superfamily predicted ATPase